MHFLNILKVHLTKGEIIDINIANNDRIIELKFKTVNEINDALHVQFAEAGSLTAPDVDTAGDDLNGDVVHHEGKERLVG